MYKQNIPLHKFSVSLLFLLLERWVFWLKAIGWSTINLGYMNVNTILLTKFALIVNEVVNHVKVFTKWCWNMAWFVSIFNEGGYFTVIFHKSFTLF